MKVVCLRNDSTALPFTESVIYEAEYLHGGMYKISNDKGSAVITPLDGYYLTFSIVK